jgi:hypothetical protein
MVGQAKARRAVGVIYRMINEGKVCTLLLCVESWLLLLVLPLLVAGLLVSQYAIATFLQSVMALVGRMALVFLKISYCNYCPPAHHHLSFSLIHLFNHLSGSSDEQQNKNRLVGVPSSSLASQGQAKLPLPWD